MVEVTSAYLISSSDSAKYKYPKINEANSNGMARNAAQRIS